MIKEYLASGFGGLNTSNFVASPSQYSKLMNYWYTYPNRDTRSFLGISKVPAISGVLQTLPSSGRGRGLYQFFYRHATDLSSYLITALCTTDYNICRLFYGGTQMTDVSAGSYSCLPYHFSFDQMFNPFLKLDTLYMCNGDMFRKWFKDSTTQEAEISPMYDVSKTQIALTGNITFTQNSKTVTTSGTWPVTVRKGGWIRSSSSAKWYEIKYVTNTTTLELRAIFAESNVTAAAAQIAAISDYQPRYILIWKDRLWMANFPKLPGGSRIGSAKVGSAKVGASSGFGSQTLACSNLLEATSVFVTGGDFGLEDHTGTNTGALHVGSTTSITGIAFIANYLLVFTAKEYVTYQYDASKLPPVSEVKRENRGHIGGNLVVAGSQCYYFTGNEYRTTDGFNDVPISADIDFDLKEVHYYDIDNESMYSQSETDNFLPTAVYDPNRNFYISFIQPRINWTRASGSVRYGYTYDINRKQWVGIHALYNVFNVISYMNVGASDASLAFIGNSSTSSIYNIPSQGYADNSTSGVVECSDNLFEGASTPKHVGFVEFWVYRGLGDSLQDYVTLAFNYYVDGALAMTNDIAKTIYPLAIEGASQDTTKLIQRLRFNVNTDAREFKWRLKDTAWNSGANNGLSITAVLIDETPLNLS